MATDPNNIIAGGWLSNEEFARVDAIAAAQGLTMSAFVRLCLLTMAESFDRRPDVVRRALQQTEVLHPTKRRGRNRRRRVMDAPIKSDVERIAKLIDAWRSGQANSGKTMTEIEKVILERQRAGWKESHQ